MYKNNHICTKIQGVRLRPQHLNLLEWHDATPSASTSIWCKSLCQVAWSLAYVKSSDVHLSDIMCSSSGDLKIDAKKRNSEFTSHFA